MSILAFLVTTIYLPGVTGTAIPTGWALLSLTLPLATWRNMSLSPLHVLGVGFLCYASASLAWAPDFRFGVYNLWHLFIIAGAFVLGGQLRSLRPVLWGLAIGITLNSMVCLIQLWGWSPVLMNHPPRPSGLMYNSVIMGSSAGLVLVWLVAQRMWWLVPGILPAFILPLSKGSFIAAGAAAVASRFGWMGLMLGAAGVGLFFFDDSENTQARLGLWVEGVKHLVPLGHGVGAIESVLLDLGGKMFMPEFLHSEPLDLAFHFGLIALLPLAVLAAPLWRTDQPEWYPYVTFAVLCLYSFPLHAPVTAFIGAVLAGHLTRGWDVAWIIGPNRGHGRNDRGLHAGHFPHTPSGSAVPVQPNATI